MATVTKIDIQSQRRVWRAIPAEVSRKHPSVRSRVSLDENGSRIGILERGGRFWVPCGRSFASFEKLDDAEIVAVGMLIECEGIGG